MFPLSHLKNIVDLTNIELASKETLSYTAGEILRYFGILLFLTRVKFYLHYLPALSLGRIMHRERFESLTSCIRFSNQPNTQGSLTFEAYRWLLCEVFKDAINKHRQESIAPSSILCADESISRWSEIGTS